MSPGPFDVTPDQIMRLGPRFTTFVNKLLVVERAALGLDGHQLSITSNEDAADGGVDAVVRGSPGTTWLPAGDSAWQFKRGNESAAACAAELAKPSKHHAREILKGGGSYVIALGGDNVPDIGVKERRDEVIAKAIELKLIDKDDRDRIRVYNATLIASWASEYPPLAVDPILEGVQRGAVDIGTWRSSRVHQNRYAADSTRDQQIDDLRSRLASTQPIDIRLQGESGIGKTRLALEALDDERFASLVAYIDDASQVGGGLIESLLDQGRHVIVVVDECPADRHVKLTAKLPANPGVKLITIGDVGASRSSGPVVGLIALADDAMDNLLVGSFPALSQEARRFVRDHSHGAPAWAIWLASAVERTPDAQAADMIARNDIEQFVTTSLPEGASFFFAAVLALFERVGWDRELRTQMETLASFAGTTPADLDLLAADLTVRRLLRSQGRYRAVDPLPVAIYLASEAWRVFGQRIIDELFPEIPHDMAIALFRRLAQLGRFEPARSVLPRLLGTDGPFGDLTAIEDGHLGILLTQLAIVLPDEVASHISHLIDEASLSHLAELREVRRDLVWTLEKLAWHTRTFELASDALLRLALAENETYANNATGTWLDLFGSVLPATAATPDQRAAYLKRASTDERSEVRELLARAASGGLQGYESISISGEIQGGVLVERRGSASTWTELGNYRRALLEILATLRNDLEPSVTKAATKALLESVHPLIDDPLIGRDLIEILSTFTGDDLRQLRVDIDHLRSMEIRYGDNNRQIVQALTALTQRLPSPSQKDELDVLLQMQSWDLEKGELQDRVTQAVRAFGPDDRRNLVGLLDAEIPAAWELGQALAATAGNPDEFVPELTNHFNTNPNALVGYLRGLVDSGNENAFDRYLDGPQSAALAARSRLSVTVRGPVTEAARSRLRDGLNAIPVRDAASLLFGWGSNFASDDLTELVEDWLERVTTQDDYNAIVDWLNLTLARREDQSTLRDSIWHVVQRRFEYPDMGREQWDWAQLAGWVLDEHALEILSLLLDLIERHDLMIHEQDSDAALIGRCLVHQPVQAWDVLGARLEDPAAWRLRMQLRGWIQSSVQTDVVDEWIGTSLERARAVATVTHPGTSEPTALGALLFSRFGSDEQIATSLWAAFIAGAWVGPESTRITEQIDHLAAWETAKDVPTEALRWSRELRNSLQLQRQAVLEREAERGY